MPLPTPGQTCFNKMSCVFMVWPQAHSLLVRNPPTQPWLTRWPTLRDASIIDENELDDDSKALGCSVHGLGNTCKLYNVNQALPVMRLGHVSLLK